jgi:hypothetical protein
VIKDGSYSMEHVIKLVLMDIMEMIIIIVHLVEIIVIDVSMEQHVQFAMKIFSYLMIHV